MMVLRRSPGARKKTGALGDFISGPVRWLGFFAGQLNGKRGAPVDGVSAVVDAVLATEYPRISREAAELFNALADEAPVYYMADATGEVRAKDEDFLVIGVKADAHDDALPWMHIRTKTLEGMWAAWLMEFIVNRQRDRLRRCQQCRRWFVDETRNKSARRCSRECTITWSNAHRSGTKAARRKTRRKGGR
jgi:hypothetical protein